MTYLEEYLQRRREEKTQEDQSPEDLLLALTANMEQVVSLTQQSTKSASRHSRAVVGAINSATAVSQVATEASKEASQEQLQVFVDFAKKTKTATSTTNKTLREINETLKGLGESLTQLVKYAKPKPSKENTRSKRTTKPQPIALQKENKDESSSNNSPVDMLLNGMFDGPNSDVNRDRGRQRRRKRTVGNNPPNNQRGGSWWDKLKSKVPDGKGLGTLWGKIPAGIKIGGGAVAAATALPAAYNLLTTDDPKVDKVAEGSKLAGSTLGSVGGWAAGASTGAALGAMTGPAAPIAVPVGALLGALGGSLLGSNVGEYAGEKAVDAYRVAENSAQEIGKSITDVYKNSIIPGFDKATSNLSLFADDLGTSMSTFMELFGKNVDELTQDLKDEATSTAAAASGIWASFKARAAELTESSKKAVGTVAAGYDKGGIVGAATATGKAASEVVESAKRSARGFASDVSATKGLAAGRWTDDEYAAITKAQTGGKSFKAGSGLTPEVREKITAKAAAAGVDPQHLMAMAQMESGGNSYAVSSTGAAGLFQFTGGTGKAYGVTNRFDDDQNIDAAIRLYKDNKAALEKRGEQATLENIYLAHQQGAGGAANLLKAARGEAKIRDDVARNMSVNVGGKEGGATDAEKAARFIEANKKHINAASAKANKVQAVQVATNADIKLDAASSSVTDAQVSHRPPALERDDSSSKPRPNTPSIVSTGVYSKPPAAEQPAIKTVTAQPMRKVAPDVQEEARPVVVANAEQIAPRTEPKKEQAPSQTTVVSASQVPSLENTPMHISDIGVVLLNMGQL